MPIPKEHEANFATLREAVEHTEVALLWCWDCKDERFVAVICAVNNPNTAGNGDSDDHQFVPLALMLGEENPYVRFLPPDHPNYPEDKDVSQDISETDEPEPPVPPGFPEFGGG